MVDWKNKMKREFTHEQIPEIAKLTLEVISKRANKSSATVVALSGDLGAGKTTITQAIAQELGIKENIISPTFVIMKFYSLEEKTWKKFIHIDAYRLNKKEELEKLGWTEIVSNPENLIFVEWPERVGDLIPKDAIRINLEHKEEKTRKIDIY